jgi:hypothetical protein
MQAFITASTFATKQNEYRVFDSISHISNCRRPQTSLAISRKADESILRPDVTIEEIQLDDAMQLKAMSNFCINMFFNADERAEKDGAFISRCVILLLPSHA